MSADNFVVAKKFDDGWKWAMGSASDEYPNGLPDSSFKSKSFETKLEAQDNAETDLVVIEYGFWDEDFYKDDELPNCGEHGEESETLSFTFGNLGDGKTRLAIGNEDGELITELPNSDLVMLSKSLDMYVRDQIEPRGG